jgi:hypothetical protein
MTAIELLPRNKSQAVSPLCMPHHIKIVSNILYSHFPWLLLEGEGVRCEEGVSEMTNLWKALTIRADLTGGGIREGICQQ